MKTINPRSVVKEDGRLYFFCKACCQYQCKDNFQDSSIEKGRQKCRSCYNLATRQKRSDPVNKLYINLYNSLRARGLNTIASKLEREDILEILHLKDQAVPDYSTLRILPPVKNEDSEKLHLYRLVC